MHHPFASERLLRPTSPQATRLLFIAPYAPLAPDYQPRAFPGDGGYPAYHQRVWSTLRELGYAVESADAPFALPEAATRTQIVFSLANRFPGPRHPEILVPSLCDALGLACVGAPPNIRALAEDKWFSKLTARSLGLPVAPGAVYADQAGLINAPDFPGPYFVKNRFGAASEGVTAESIQEDWAGAARIARALFDRGMTPLVERFAPGLDVTLPVIGTEIGPWILDLVRPGSDQPFGLITEDLKRDDPLGYALFDAGPDAELFRADAWALWRGVGPMDYLRLDYRYDPATGRRAFLEFNLCCHIGRSGAICLAAARHGLTQSDLLGHVVEFCRRRCAALRRRR